MGYVSLQEGRFLFKIKVVIPVFFLKSEPFWGGEILSPPGLEFHSKPSFSQHRQPFLGQKWHSWILLFNIFQLTVGFFNKHLRTVPQISPPFSSRFQPSNLKQKLMKETLRNFEKLSETHWFVFSSICFSRCSWNIHPLIFGDSGFIESPGTNVKLMNSPGCLT